MSFFKNPCNRYFILWSLYSLKGILYPDGSLINQAIMLFIILLSLRETYYIMVIKKPTVSSMFFCGLTALILMYTVYGIVLFATDGLVVHGKGVSFPSMYYLEGAWVILMPIYVCYRYTRLGYLSQDLLRRWIVVFLIIAVFQYYHTQDLMYRRVMEMGRNVDGVTNNAGYILLALIPGMLLFRRRVIKYIGIAICVFFVLMSMKRGAILIAAITLVLIILHDLRFSRGVYKIGVMALIAIGIVLLFNYVEYLLANSTYFNLRLEATLSGDVSLRDEIYANYWNVYLNDTSFFQMLFGRGAMATIKVGGEYAHNDWLEILLGQGVLGIGIFIFYWICFYKTIRSKNLSKQSRFVLAVILCIFGVKSFFSMSITGMPIFASSVLGLALADGCRDN